ncbi:RNA polymerase sigma-70 factor, ECF subfamily [Sinomicrobium oceani]|uniref:RNA polymerase sigma-70 factor, ECF subfamily n=1 Tax=Sinomicrobium oceani TaxID=1150368 RepID=A0A1K1R459_9FLAO|nr:RNA polymerase sigma-70 factor [Sinomicrobium oceani]SFW66398.1 RNA polymerase sigma-70 factor, ECF subfamily [Sinomicrobium oceani]
MKSLIPDIKKGDQESFKAFFDDFYPILCSFAKKYVGSSDLSEDIAQEAFIRYWEQRGKFDHIRSVKSFLYIAVRNRCLTVLKRNRKITDESVLLSVEGASFLKENILDQEIFHHVRLAVASLPARQAEIVDMTLEGIKNPEIAERLGITENTVKTIKRNAFRKLRELLKDRYYLLLFF